MRKQNIIILLAMASLVLLSCDKNEIAPGEQVEIFLLESYETIDNSCQIDESSVVIKGEPLLYYSDLLFYDKKEFIFNISDRGKAAIDEMDFPVNGVAFAVIVDSDVIYTAYFWPSYSSAGCQWVVADPFFVDLYDGLKIQLGYPGPVDGIEIPDKRNDPMILKTFKKDGKLRD